jgi:polar amino acid transport system substrate-binding protein
MLKEMGMGDVRLLSPTLAEFPVYHYLNKKHAALVPKLTSILMEMQNNKMMKEIQKSVITDLGLE